ncbi:uncharacterized protein LOC115747272 isoform X2 [Rhodamnia argentea]|uniref:Uncharacterized protein LOC115747272 isoform X2 n=1 Tax=Rhodamnia argentea TaxID=178133 RepID=A0ABM3GVT8_9MYRT|nr:uncharacterized protein LOC115747272 isoform X2 [Rhodamnia argentea]
MVPDDWRTCPYSLIEEITNDFSEENYIGSFQFGKVYRGDYEGKKVTVKISEDKPLNFLVRPGEVARSFREESYMHMWLTKSGLHDLHPNIVKCLCHTYFEGYFARVYDLNPLDTLHNLVTKDSFTWHQRIRAALGLANFLAYLHCFDPPLLVRNLDAAHVMIDQDYNAVLYDFSMLSGGYLTDRSFLIDEDAKGCHGYMDPNFDNHGKWSNKADVFAYGVVLLCLIGKRVYTEEDRLSPAPAPSVYEWAENEYNGSKPAKGSSKIKSSLVDESLKESPLFKFKDSLKITKLAMQCIKHNPHRRPSMKQVVSCLLNLHIVQYDKEAVGFDHKLFVEVTLPNPLKDKFKDLYSHLSSWFYFGGIRRTVPFISNRFYSQNQWPLGWRSSFFSQPFHIERTPCPSIANKRSILIEAAKRHGKMQLFSFEDLSQFTDEFSMENFIGNFQFGKMYHGKIGSRAVTVKILDKAETYFNSPGVGELMDELTLLRHPEFILHPSMVKLVGYCCEDENLGVVYDLNSLDTAQNLLTEDSFTWMRRIKVALGCARLLEFLHSKDGRDLPYAVRNIRPSHIMVDKEYNPIMFEFAMFTGGILPLPKYKKLSKHKLCLGYTECHPEDEVCGFQMGEERYDLRGGWTETDVLAFGTVLLNLITMRPYKYSEGPFPHDWAKEYEEKIAGSDDEMKCSLVHASLQANPGFYSDDGPKITRLAMQCIESSRHDRPSMRQVVNQMLKLRIIRKHAKALGFY